MWTSRLPYSSLRERGAREAAQTDSSTKKKKQQQQARKHEGWDEGKEKKMKKKTMTKKNGRTGAGGGQQGNAYGAATAGVPPLRALTTGVGQVERDKDVVALRLEAFVRDASVQREADQAPRGAAAAANDDDHERDDDDDEGDGNEEAEEQEEGARGRRRVQEVKGHRSRGERVMGLLGRERDLEAALALFEARTTSDDHLRRMPPALLSLLADPKRTHHECAEPLMEMFVEFVWEHYYYGRPLKSSAGDEGGRGAVLLPPADDLRAETDEEEEEKNAWRTFRRMATDLRHPHAWYPLARALPGGRRIVLHVGPTNRHAHARAFPSLTHEALTRLAASRSGVYCGPLRLLAEEVFRRMNKEGVACSLLTGQRVVTDPTARHLACTVEMADVARHMLGDQDRGWAWTRALLGLPAAEVHLCGNESIVPLVQKICQDTGERLHVHHYTRLSPLVVSDTPLGRKWYKSLRAGDCVVAFSRADIHTLKREIERNTRHRCCVVYGNLPPQTRAELFNDPASEYEVLVASDAIGMGLNLNISRVVFSTLHKFDGHKRRLLTDSEIKQIAGRAGRYRSIFPTGEVTAFDGADLPRIRRALLRELEPLPSAGLAPTFEQVSMFSRVYPQSPFYELLDELTLKAAVSSHYFLCGNDDRVSVAKLIESVPLSLRERFKFSIAPFANSHASEGEVEMDLRPERGDSKSGRLAELESFHHVLDLYLWLSYRFDSFTGRDRAIRLKQETEQRIQELLVSQTEASKQSRAQKGSALDHIKGHLQRQQEGQRAAERPPVVLGTTTTAAGGGERRKARRRSSEATGTAAPSPHEPAQWAQALNAALAASTTHRKGTPAKAQRKRNSREEDDEDE
ncbi:helicase conserved Cterminal domain containing protein [Acanthamoeba castellanii str. Neff]|uniref:Helicase conserved Cterminal domain containing protein n=1 Tax=Acanthamoeba castellanii (strain ATCC 30010 / Neff) TaxID=1257118 RepID=L8GRN9_ACACF|nr:helicase conserved Cterminal domain containing protein [Acanthamoeba castellanii str. Neff]ELR14811.1 helicase conserved Cterminal domain containing protein [Acanthamoeba castellanii str. Neff]